MQNGGVLQPFARFAPVSASFVAFLTGASFGASIVPVILSTWPDRLKVSFIVVSGLLFVPAGGLLGIALRNRVAARNAPRPD